MYRWYLADPIRFERSLVWTIEHGHANDYENDYTSSAYWYQREPHRPHPPLPGVLGRLPRCSQEILDADAMRVAAYARWRELGAADLPPDTMRTLRSLRNGGCLALARDDAGKAEELFGRLIEYRL
jgi:hypothetical protein